jgi:hypothetical protein
VGTHTGWGAGRMTLVTFVVAWLLTAAAIGPLLLWLNR